VDNSANEFSKEKKQEEADSDHADTDDDAEDSKKQKKIAPNKSSHGDETTLVREWSETFTWQEKKFGPRELIKYLPRDGDQPVSRTAVENEYRELLGRKLRYGEDVLGGVSKVMLFTYTDKDSFVPKNELTKFVSTSENFDLNSMAESIVTLPANGNMILEDDDTGYDDNDYASMTNRGRIKAWKDTSAGHRLFRESPYKIFYIMCCVDVDTGVFKSVQKQESKTGFDEDHSLLEWSSKDAGSKFYEVVLCVIKVNREGNIVEMQPGFSDSPLFGSVSESDRQWYRFTSPLGSVFEYSIVNLADNSNPVLEREINAVHRAQLEETYAYMDNRIPNVLSGRPNKSTSKILSVYLELASLHGFENAASDRLYVQYEVLLPSNGKWTWVSSSSSSLEKGRAQHDSNHPLRGVTQTCKCKYVMDRNANPLLGKNNTQDGQDEKYEFKGHLCFPLEIEMEYEGSDDEIDLQVPKIFLQIMSRDMFERHRVEGYGHISLSSCPGMKEHFLKTWKVAGSLRNKATDFYIGGALQLDSSLYTEFPQTHSGSFLNRYGFTSMTSGSIKIKVHTIVNSYMDPTVTNELNRRISQQRKTGVSQMDQNNPSADNSQRQSQRRRTVTEILNNLKFGNSNSTAAPNERTSDLIASLQRIRSKRSSENQ